MIHLLHKYMYIHMYVLVSPVTASDCDIVLNVTFVVLHVTFDVLGMTLVVLNMTFV